MHYAVLQSELTGEVSKELEESEKIKYSGDVEKLTKAIDNMENELENLKKDHVLRMEEGKKKYTQVLGDLQNITYKLMKSDDYR